MGKKWLISCMLFFLFSALSLNSKESTDSLLNVLKIQNSGKSEFSITDTSIVSTLEHIASNYSTVRDFSKSEYYMSRAISILKGIIDRNNSYNGLKSIRKRYALDLVTLSYYYREEGKIAKAIDIGLLTLRIREAIGDSLGYLRSHNNLGMLYSDQGNYSKALDMYFKGLKICNEQNNVRLKAIILNNIGLCYGFLEDYEKSLIYFERSLKEAVRADVKWQQAICLDNIGLIYFKNGNRNIDSAYAKFKRAEIICREINDSSGVGNSLINQANLFKSKNDLSTSINLLVEAERILYAVKDLKGYHLSRVNLASIYIDRVKNGTASLKELDKSITERLDAAILHFTFSQNKTYLKDAYLYYSEFYRLKKDPEKAFEYYRSHIIYKDSILSDDIRKKTLKAELNYEYEIKEQRAKLEQERKDEIALRERHKDRIVKISLAIGFILTILIALLIYIGYNNKRKANHLITNQKTELEKQKKIVEKQKELVELKQKQIIQSIDYANHIQTSILPTREEFSRLFPEGFIFFKPRDIVSGDFYWFKRLEDDVIIIVGDCTGHGIPGAFLSVMITTMINEIVINQKITMPQQIIIELADRLRMIFKHEESNEVSDGLDLSVAYFNPVKRLVRICSVNQYFYVVSKRKVRVCDPQINSFTGIFGMKQGNSANEQEVILAPGEKLILASDGYHDQLGGSNRKKLMVSRLSSILMECMMPDSKEAEDVLQEKLNEWKGELAQTDDVLIVGI